MLFCKVLAIILMLAITSDVDGVDVAATIKLLPTTAPNISVIQIPENKTDDFDLSTSAEKRKFQDMVTLLNETIQELKKFKDNTNEVLQNATYEDGIHHPRVHDVVDIKPAGNQAVAAALPTPLLAIATAGAVAVGLFLG